MDRRHFLQSAAVAAAALAAGTPSVLAAGLKQSMIGMDSDGRPFDLAGYMGKVTLVSFFTAGCNLCTHDLKLMREFYVDNRAKNFSLIGVNIDAKKEDYVEYAHLVTLTTPADQRFPLIWRNAPDHADTFGPVSKQPTHFVLNKDLELIFKREGTFQPQDWDQVWSKL
jgi:peroxiredoxin